MSSMVEPHTKISLTLLMASFSPLVRMDVNPNICLYSGDIRGPLLLIQGTLKLLWAHGSSPYSFITYKYEAIFRP